MRESRTYGRRSGRKLRSFKQGLMDNLLPTLEIKIEDNQIIGDTFNPQDYRGCFLEIGFGAGEHLALQAKENPEILMVGCEPFVNGVANLLEQIEEEKLTNIRIYPGNALDFLGAIPDHSLDHIFLLFPDPWPKKAHHKRRFVQEEVLTLLAQKLSKGGKLLMATDHADYFEWMCEKTFVHEDLVHLNPDPDTWHTPPDLWTKTRFQSKAEKARRPSRFLWFGKHP